MWNTWFTGMRRVWVLTFWALLAGAILEDGKVISHAMQADKLIIDRATRSTLLPAWNTSSIDLSVAIQTFGNARSIWQQ
jgi:hypothetical protein